MSDGWTEREGGIWKPASRVSSKLILERFDSRRHSFQLIWQRDCDGYFQVEFLIKDEGASDPQWSLPFWEDIAQGGIIESQSAAEALLKSISDERSASL